MPTKKEKQPLSVTHPELAKEADGWDPKSVTAGSSKCLSWKCQKGHSFDSVVNKRANYHHGCPFCSSHKILKGFNDLSTTHPLIAREASGWDPSTVIKGNKNKFNWKCPQGHIYAASVDSRTNMSSKCSVCNGKSVLFGYNDLQTLFPNVAKEANGWDPKLVSGRSNKKLPWKCSQGHRFITQVDQRTRLDGGTNCPICVNQKILKGFNDLQTRFPKIAKEADGWDPTKIGAGHRKKLKWKCNLGHFYEASAESRTQKLSGCPVCAGLKILIGYNDLKTTHPLIVREASGWDPTTVIAGSAKKYSWKCSKGHIYSTSINKRATRNQGCAICADYGFNPGKKAFLYFLKHQVWDMYQVGITNFPDDRLARHKNRGWEVLEIRGPMDGHLTQQWETAILRMLKAKGADLTNPKIAGKFDGYSEAWSKSTFEVKSIKELMRLTEEFEGK